MIRRCWYWVLALAVLPGVLRAEPPPVKKLTLQPAAAPVPALKYHLVPDLAEQTPGNAVLQYYRAYSPEWLSHREPETYKKINQWLELPPGQLPRKDLAWILTYRPLQAIDQGARRETVDWDLTRRVREEGFSLLLPDIQGYRDFANLLKLRAGLEIAEGRYDRAVYSLETGFTLARHLGEAPTVITGLVGITVGALMADQVESFIQSPGAPNLYWALTNLPRPLVSLRKPFQGEDLAFEKYFPLPRGLEARPLSLAEAQHLLRGIALAIRGFDEEHLDRDSLEVDWTAVGLVVKSYTPAKRFLLERGLRPDLVEAMPAPQVVLLYARIQFDRMHDELFKWLNLPFWEARPGLARTQREIREAARSRREGGVWLAGLFLPAVDKMLLAQARLERQLAALRVIEAIRLHAASHDGRLPSSLHAITEVPIPIDPITGKEFEYRLDGEAASLRAQPPPGYADVPQYSLHYQITLKR